MNSESNPPNVNPYSATTTEAPQVVSPSVQALDKIRGPALGLLITSGMFIGLLFLSLLGNLFFLVSGLAGDGPQAVTPLTRVIIRMIFGILLMLVNGLIFYGALRMRNLQNRKLAFTAAVLAIIPIIGPCYILGIPFGVWALAVLNDQVVKNAFRS